MRLTKDVDFDRADGVSTAAVQSSVKKALRYAAQSAGLRGAQIDAGKSTETTVRMRLAGTVSGAPVRFVVEVSGRNPVPPDCQSRVQVTPPARYGIAPFAITTYTHAMLAASKVLAVMGANRNVPRDVYDLHDLLAADPTPILARSVGLVALKEIQATALDKICAIDYTQAQQELLAYIPAAQREALGLARWEEMALTVSQAVQQWVGYSIEKNTQDASQTTRPA
jgi:Nucleotidyl transferase AbiEii toxin, Type IV TA system